MSAIEFVVRNDAGGLQRGEVSGTGQDASIIVSQGQDISLNLQRSHVLSYARQGQALQVMLVDGQVITIQGFFGPDGTPLNDLFLSSGGQLAQVQLVPGDGNLLLAQYVDEDGFGKWSPDDDLYFIEVATLDVPGVDAGADVGMLGVPLLAGFGGLGGGAAAAGAAALGGGLLLTGGGSNDDGDDTGAELGGGGNEDGDDDGGDEKGDGGGGGTGGDGGDSAPEISITGGTRASGTVVNGEDWDDGVEISGTGTPGGSATLIINNSTIPFDIDENGQWAVTVPTSIAGEGEYSYEVVATVTTGGGTSSATDVLDVDTVNVITIDTSVAGGDGTVSQTERGGAGVKVVGTAEANALVTVTFNDGNGVVITETTTSNASGSWSHTFTGTDVARGEYVATVTAESTDAAGNTATARGNVEIDTEAFVSINNGIVEQDGVINMVERADGVVITGTAEAFSEVRVSFESGTRTVVATENGTWSASFNVSEIESGNIERVSTIHAVATDQAGNIVRTQADVTLDTWVNRLTMDTPVEGEDNTVNRAEASDGVTLTGTVELGATEVIVGFDATDSGMASAAVSRAATVNPATGKWSVTFAAGEIPEGTYGANVVVEAKDMAGNSRSITGAFAVDTDVPDAPMIEGIGDYTDGVTFVSIDTNPDNIRVHSYDEGANARTLIAVDSDGKQDFPNPGMETFGFDNPVVNGKQLVVSSADAAGNTNSTLLVVDATTPIDVTAAGLDSFNIGSIDLKLADNASLSLTKADIDALSDNDNVLVIHGAVDDMVNLNGTAVSSGTQQINGQTYDVYNLGDDTQLIIDQDIRFTQSVV
ncbi:hypothetical protein [Loktanella sp. SALINAS62]|uniref:BapA/Bap/LapF family prefix-like domain-containing protein n=1 Tax=Loktanella sp. SALINAS62 TaxID=2706124 RepID=UPI001B8BE1B9|nr:hypothetical protein [Loktanella sp. SALINAS62]MBS1304254.1 hypothetical protein [Loktanella sp. SALINAS62]